MRSFLDLWWPQLGRRPGSGRRTSHTMSLRPGLLYLLAGLLLVACAGPGSPGPERGTGVERTKVVLVGIDGATFRVLDPLLAAGRLPRFQALIEAGARGPLRSEAPILSPPVWTTVVTGRPRGVHGIGGFFQKTAEGDEVLVDSTLRRVGALWNWLGPLDRTVGFAGWWASWPAEPVAGWMISDRTARNQWSAWPGGTPAERLVHPPELWSRLEPLVFDPSEPPIEELAALADFTVDELRHLEELERPIPYDPLSDLEFAYLAQRSYEEMTLELLAEEQPDLTGVFLIAPDPVSHSFWHLYEPEAFAGVDPGELTPEKVERLGGLVPAIYQHVDRFLGRLLPLLAEGTVVLIVSDHGFEPTGHLHPSGDHHPDGVLILSGGPIRAGVHVESASIYDVAPTVLRLLGLPVPEDLEGRVWEEVLRPEFRTAHPRRTVASLAPLFDPGRAARPAEDPGDREMRELLRSLGYLD